MSRPGTCTHADNLPSSKAAASAPDDVLVVIQLLQEHDLPERPLRSSNTAVTFADVSGFSDSLLSASSADPAVWSLDNFPDDNQPAGGTATWGPWRHEGRACASVAFWKASKIFFRAITSRVFLSTAFHTMPYACGGGTSTVTGQPVVTSAFVAKNGQ